MKRVIHASSDTDVYSILTDIPDDEYAKLNQSEKKIIAKAANCTQPEAYLQGAADALECSGVKLSESFIQICNSVVENYNFDEHTE